MRLNTESMFSVADITGWCIMVKNALKLFGAGRFFVKDQAGSYCLKYRLTRRIG